MTTPETAIATPKEEVDEGTVWYFAIGSMMLPASYQQRNFQPLASQPAELMDYKIHFFGQGGFAEALWAPGESMHGVLHKVTKEQMLELDQIEVGYVRKSAKARPYFGGEQQLLDATVYCRPSREEVNNPPAERYMEILIAGAKHFGLDADYVALLEKHEIIPRTPPQDFKTFGDPPPGNRIYESVPETQEDGPIYFSLNGKILEISYPLDCQHREWMRQLRRKKGPYLEVALSQLQFDLKYGALSDIKDCTREHSAYLEDGHYRFSQRFDVLKYYKVIGTFDQGNATQPSLSINAQPSAGQDVSGAQQNKSINGDNVDHVLKGPPTASSQVLSATTGTFSPISQEDKEMINSSFLISKKYAVAFPKEDKANQDEEDQPLAFGSEKDQEMVTMSYLLAEKYGVPVTKAGGAKQSFRVQPVAVRSEEDHEMVTMSYLLAKKYGVPLPKAEGGNQTIKDQPLAVRSEEDNEMVTMSYLLAKKYGIPVPLSKADSSNQSLRGQTLAVRSEEDNEMVTMSYLLAKKYGVPISAKERSMHPSPWDNHEQGQEASATSPNVELLPDRPLGRDPLPALLRNQPRARLRVQPGAQRVAGWAANSGADEDDAQSIQLGGLQQAPATSEAQSENRGLVEARAVVDPELTQARQVDASQSIDHKRRCKVVLSFCLLLIALVIGCVLLAVSHGSKPNQVEEQSTGDRSTTFSDRVLSLLPADTVQAIQTDNSPQNKAFQWILADPFQGTHSDARIIQRFALATLYHSTNGEKWHSQDNWLSYVHHECEWFLGKSDAPGADFFAPFLDLMAKSKVGDGACVFGESADAGEYRQLTLINNFLKGSIPRELFLMKGLQTLNLGSNQLKGTIPLNITQLENLTGLVLERNSISGTIPSQLGSLTEMQALAIGQCRIMGTLPTELGLLRDLELLFLAENQLSGTLPSEFGGLQQLLFLILSDNQLTGSLPTEIGLMNSVSFIQFYGNLFSGSLPSELGQIQALHDLQPKLDKLRPILPPVFMHTMERSSMGIINLHYNQHLSGSLPSELGLLSAVRELNIDRNNLTGPIPSAFGMMTSLTQLDMWQNNLSGPIPSEFGMLTSLTKLDMGENGGWENDLRGNGFTSMPSELGLLSHLKRLNLDKCRIGGAIPSEFGSLSNVQILHVEKNLLSGPLPTQLGLLSNLQTLLMDNNQLSGSLPTQLGLLSSLKRFEIHKNFFTGPIPLYTFSPPLETLSFNENLFTGELPSDFEALTHIQALELEGYFLSGTIPTQLGILTQLRRLNLQDNNLSGKLPSEIGNLRHLEYLNIKQNFLAGNLPSELFLLSKAEFLHLGENSFSGHIPSELGLLYSIEVCNLGSNNLSGGLPTNLGSLSNLKDLNLPRNLLTGGIPSELGLLRKLTMLSLHDNTLKGPIPQEFYRMETLQWVFLRGNQFSGILGSEVGFLTNLVRLEISGGLKGQVPSELGLIQSMDSLTLPDCSFSGTIPSQLGKLTNLLYFNFRNTFNKSPLGGPIPFELGGIPGMIHFDMLNNSLSESIPSQMAQLSKIRYFRISANDMTGSIPSWLAGFTDLTALNLDRNLMTGQIPSQLGMSRLVVLSIGNNNLTGSIPTQLALLGNIQWFDASNTSLKGTIPENFCPAEQSDFWEYFRGLVFDCSDMLCGCSCNCSVPPA